MKRCVLVASICFAGGVFQPVSKAANMHWLGSGADNDWSTEANWEGGVKPAAGDAVYIGHQNKLKEAYVEVTQPETCSAVTLASQNSVGTLVINGGSVTGTGRHSFALSTPALATLIVSNGVFSGGYIWSGRNPGGTGIIEVVDGSIEISENTLIGETLEGTGIVRQYGGSFLSKNLTLGSASGASGYYELHGGALATGSGTTVANSTGTSGEFIQTGGTNTVGGSLVLGNSSTAEGVYELRGGELFVGSHFHVGSSGTGTLTQVAGKATINGYVRIGRNANSTGIYNLYGGVLSVTNSNNSFQHVLVGEEDNSSGVLNIGSAETPGVIENNLVGGAAFRLYVRNKSSAEGTVRGWGTAGFTAVINNGRIIADGYGVDRDLDISGTVSSSIANTEDNGWFAVNGGRLKLQETSVARNDTYRWGFGSGAPGLVNSLTMDLVGEAGVLRGMLLAADRDDVPTHSFKPLAFWDFGDAPYSAAATIRYDDEEAERMSVDQSALVVYQHDGTCWVPRKAVVDTANKLISADLHAPLGKIAVGASSGTVLMLR